MDIADSGVSVASFLYTSSRKDIRWSSIGIGAAYAQIPEGYPTKADCVLDIYSIRLR